MHIDRIACIVLAAGKSRRFGSSKMNHRLADGKMILSKTIEQYQKVFTDVSVVVPNDAKVSQIAADLSTNLVTVESSSQGMSHSLMAGIESKSNADAWMVVLADMPYVRVDTISMLSKSVNVDNIVVPICHYQQGNPVTFGRNFKKDLMSLTGDVGAKQVIKNNTLSVSEVKVRDEGVLLDIDRIGDVQ